MRTSFSTTMVNEYSAAFSRGLLQKPDLRLSRSESVSRGTILAQQIDMISHLVHMVCIHKNYQTKNRSCHNAYLGKTPSVRDHG